MRQDIALKWIEALRSGKYKQGRSWLCKVERGETERKYCCLGVLCDISNLGEWELEGSEGGNNYSYLGEGGTLPSELKKEFETNSIGQLISLNDTLCYDFNQIADYIEQNCNTI